MTQTNSSSAVSAAGNKNSTDQSVDQSAGGSSGGSAVQYADQKAGNTQDATSDATSHQIGASNANYPVRIGSPGGGGSVTQVNASGALSAAGNKNDTNQTATQDAGGPVVKQLPLSDGCSDKCAKPSYGGCGTCGGGGGPVVQDVKQKAYNDQTADSSAESTQCCAQNTNAPVRIKSYGDDGDVKQANLSGATRRPATRTTPTSTPARTLARAPSTWWGSASDKDGCGGHGDGGPVVQQADQYASNDQSPHSHGRLDPEGCEQQQRPRPHQCAGRRWQRHPGQLVARRFGGGQPQQHRSVGRPVGRRLGGGVTVQALGQKAHNGQDADSHATSEQYGASNANSPVRIKSDGDDGDVTQSNLSGAFSAAGNSQRHHAGRLAGRRLGRSAS